MLAAWIGGGGDAARPDERIARSLGLFAGQPADYFLDGQCAFAQLSGPRARPTRGWRPAKAGSGSSVLLHGYLDNSDALIADLNLAPRTPDATVYACAIDRWGDEADRHCVGVYCSIAVDKWQRNMRLARSPFDAPPLYFHSGGARMLAASVPRVLFAAGVERKLDRRLQLQNLNYSHREGGDSWYEGIGKVGTGTIVRVGLERTDRVAYYDATQFAAKSNRTDDAPEEAFALLAEAAGKVCKSITAPAMLLSGGLDSPLAALALLEALPAQVILPTYTFVPCAGWDGIVPPNLIGDERPFVEAFAEMHPRIRPTFFPNEGVTFDHRWPELFLATDVAPAGLPNFYMYHALWRSAVEAGCDGVISADYGNFSYSVNAPWASAEYLRTGRLKELLLSIRARPGDQRGLVRRLIALALMPHLPPGLRRAMRRLAGRDVSPTLTHYSALNPALFQDPAVQDGRGGRLDPFESFATRDHKEFAADWLSEGDGYGSDINQGFQQIYGIRSRDVTAYRPLIEFCLALATEEFESGGVDRRLARRMGEGRVPDTIRDNRRNGRHGVDWHARMGPQRVALITELQSLKTNPGAAEMLDLDRAIRALQDWPEKTDFDLSSIGPRAGIVTRAVLAGRFLNFVEGRNDV